MKKILESGKLWTVLSAFIFVMTFSLVVYAATNLTTSSPYTSWKTSSTDKILDEDEWNTLMEKLSYDAIPEGAVMAFAGRTTCPDGWSKYTDANGRFLMGANGGYGDKGGANSVTLTRDQIPPHSHIYKDTIGAESHSVYLDNGKWGDLLKNGKYQNYFWWGRYDVIDTIVGSNQSDGDNRPVYGYRKTADAICFGDGDGAFISGGNQYDYCNQNPQSVDITNEYVKVLFCVKGAYESDTPSNPCNHYYPNGNQVAYVNGSCEQLKMPTGNTIYVYNYDGTYAGMINVIGGGYEDFFKKPSNYKLEGICANDKYVAYGGDWHWYKLSSECNGMSPWNYSLSRKNKFWEYQY